MIFCISSVTELVTGIKLNLRKSFSCICCFSVLYVTQENIFMLE